MSYVHVYTPPRPANPGQIDSTSRLGRRAALLLRMTVAVADAPDHIEYAALRTQDTSQPCPNPRCPDCVHKVTLIADERRAYVLLCASCGTIMYEDGCEEFARAFMLRE